MAGTKTSGKPKRTHVREDRQEEKSEALYSALNEAFTTAVFEFNDARYLLSVLEEKGFVLMRKPKGKK